jgi:DNA repair protein RecO (recombination protein O)
MEQRTTGLILRTRPLTETSLIVQWLTPDLGRVSTVAKGARRTKSPFAGKLDLFYLADFSFSPSRRSDLHTLREVGVREYHVPLRQHLGYLQQACYFAQLLEQTTEPNTPLPGLFELILAVLAALPQALPHSRTVFAFEFKLLAHLGLQPDFAETDLTPGAREIAQRLEAADWTVLARLSLAAEQSLELDRFLHTYWAYHVGRSPKGRAAALHPA